MRLFCPSCGIQETKNNRFCYSFYEHDTKIYLCILCGKDGTYEKRRLLSYEKAASNGEVKH